MQADISCESPRVSLCRLIQSYTRHPIKQHSLHKHIITVHLRANYHSQLQPGNTRCAPGSLTSHALQGHALVTQSIYQSINQPVDTRQSCLHTNTGTHHSDALMPLEKTNLSVVRECLNRVSSSCIVWKCALFAGVSRRSTDLAGKVPIVPCCQKA